MNNKIINTEDVIRYVVFILDESTMKFEEEYLI